MINWCSQLGTLPVFTVLLLISAILALLLCYYVLPLMLFVYLKGDVFRQSVYECIPDSGGIEKNALKIKLCRCYGYPALILFPFNVEQHALDGMISEGSVVRYEDYLPCESGYAPQRSVFYRRSQWEKIS
jgi:hypothetical protein